MRLIGDSDTDNMVWFTFCLEIIVAIGVYEKLSSRFKEQMERTNGCARITNDLLFFSGGLSSLSLAKHKNYINDTEHKLLFPPVILAFALMSMGLTYALSKPSEENFEQDIEASPSDRPLLRPRT